MQFASALECPRCDTVYEDWYRASINLDLDDFDEEYLRDAATATCPNCGHVIEMETLVVEHGRLALEQQHVGAAHGLTHGPRVEGSNLRM